jgi:hypothetical protein
MHVEAGTRVKSPFFICRWTIALLYTKYWKKNLVRREMKMKKRNVLFLALFFFTGGAGGLLSTTFAVELTPFVRLGTINWREKSINEGHKYLQAAGLRVASESTDCAVMVAVEAWRMGEPIDEDREMPSKGYSLSGEVDYLKRMGNHLLLYPYVGASFERFGRVDEGNIKYPESWSSVHFLTLALGGGVRYKIAFAKAGLQVPCYVRTDDNLEPKSQPGFDFEIGIRWKGLSAGWFYKRISFGEFGSETARQPDFEFNRYGAIIKYSF